MSHKQRSMKWAIKKNYTEKGVPYDCPRIGERVTLDCFFTLDAPQGAEGFLGPCCCEVRCPALSTGNCPLTHGKGTVLNEMRVSVLKGERSLLLEDDGTVFEVADARPNGQVIWFGLTTVFGDENT